MAMAMPEKLPAGLAADRQWYIVGRWQEFEGEGRTNLLRMIAIGAFYLVQLVNFHGVHHGAEPLAPYHRQVTLVCAAWTLLALAILLCLQWRMFPAALKYCSTGCDMLLLTTLAAARHAKDATEGVGPSSPLLLVYFLIIALAALRFSLGLVWFSTLGGMLGYLTLVAVFDRGKWFDADHTVPPVTQLVTLLSLALTGLFVGQVVRRVKGIAQEYAQRLAEASRKV